MHAALWPDAAHITLWSVCWQTRDLAGFFLALNEPSLTRGSVARASMPLYCEAKPPYDCVDSPNGRFLLEGPSELSPWLSFRFPEPDLGDSIEHPPEFSIAVEPVCLPCRRSQVSIKFRPASGPSKMIMVIWDGPRGGSDSWRLAVSLSGSSND